MLPAATEMKTSIAVAQAAFSGRSNRCSARPSSTKTSAMSTSAAIPQRNNVSFATMLAAVAVASPGAKIEPRTAS